MNKLIIIVALIFILLMSIGYACDVDIIDEITELRSEQDGYDERIYAEDNSDIDIRINFEIVDVDGSDCSSNITARAKVYRWDPTDDEWDYWKTTTSKNQSLEEDEFTFTWSNDFMADDSYEEYKIEGIILEGSNELEIMDSYIDMEDNTCDGIELIAGDFTIDEGDSETRNFKIENNTNKDFEINSVSVYFSDALVSSGSVDFPSTVDGYEDEVVEVTLNAGYVSSTETTEGTFRVSGYLDGDYCSEGNVGRKTFDVTVRETGSGGGGSTTSSDCDDLEIHTKTITIEEGAETKEIFYLRNNSTKRFEMLEVDTTENGLELRSYYFEKYAFPGDIADIVIQAIAPNVTSNKTFENDIKVKGKFSDGKVCDFDDIEKKNYDVYITDSSGQAPLDCGTITIDVPNEIRIVNSATIPFKIQNNSNTKVDVIIESELVVDPTLISLPGNTSMSRDLFVSMDGAEGNIYLNAQSACPVQSKTIKVINSATGSLSQVDMKAEIIIDNGISILRISFNNSTDKLFIGVINADLDGLLVDNRVISVAPGETFTDIPLDTNNSNLSGTVIFTSNDQEIIATVGSDSDGGLFAGFFGLGFEAAGIAIILILVIIAIVLIVTLYEGTRYEEEDQPFVKTKQ